MSNFSLSLVLGLVAAVVLAHGSLLHAFGMILIGLLWLVLDRLVRRA